MKAVIRIEALPWVNPHGCGLQTAERASPGERRESQSRRV